MRFQGSETPDKLGIRCWPRPSGFQGQIRGLAQKKSKMIFLEKQIRFICFGLFQLMSDLSATERAPGDPDFILEIG